MREHMLQSLFLHTEHVAPSRAASHASLGTLSAGGRALGQRAQSLPVRHAERLLALGLEARARSGRATPRGLQGVVGARAQTGFSAAASCAQRAVEFTNLVRGKNAGKKSVRELATACGRARADSRSGIGR